MGLPSIISHISTALADKTSFGSMIHRIINLSHSEEMHTSVHGLNILKDVFNNQNLKPFVEPYLALGFERAILGFSSEDWNIRNSSLMLFSSLSKRVFPKDVEKGPSPIEFFARMPSLLPFFIQEIKSFIHKESVMFPSLYPIALLFSRLRPFDGKVKLQTDI